MKIKIIITTLVAIFILACNPPYLEDNISFEGSGKITAPASFYININPYCCERRGLDSADVVNAALESYGSKVEFTLVPGNSVVDGTEKAFTLNLLDNTKNLNGEHRYDNCDKLVSHAEVLSIGDWTVVYMAKDELGRLETRTAQVTIQSDNTFYNCFRIF